MNNIVLPGCSPPEKYLFKPNSPLDNFFKKFDELTRGISLKSTFFITLLYFVFNVFHLIILTRQSMKSLTVSSEMILIAICGVITGVAGVFKSIVEIIDHEYICAHSYWYFFLVLIYFLLFQAINQIILWEIVYITFLRAAVILDVRYGMKTDKLKRSMRTFIYILFAIFLLNHLFRMGLHRIEEVSEKEKRAVVFPGCASAKEYTIVAISGNCLRRIMLIIAGVTSVIIPILCMLVLSVFLVLELHNPSGLLIQAQTPESTQRQNSAARALLLFLCFYVLAELPYVLLFGLGVYNPADFEQLDEYTYTQVDIFIYINMCMGILVYCLMSSQYRATVLVTFWKKSQVSSTMSDKSSKGTP